MNTDQKNLKYNKRVIIVTGCGSGIGLELAKQLYTRWDLNVVVTGRKKSLDQIKKIFTESDSFILRELDIVNDGNIYSLIHEIINLWGRIDVVINNAAVCFRAVIEHMDEESEIKQLKTNYLGPMTLIRAVLPIMREQRSGSIINVSSVAGMMAMPTMGSYSASKHALQGATEALWYEARPFGINVNLIQLGFINSNSFKRVVLSSKAAISIALGGPHSEYYSSMTPIIEKLMSYSLVSSEKVATKIIQLVDKPSGRLLLSLTPDAIVFNILKNILPAFLFNKFLYLLLPGTIKSGGRWKADKSLGNLPQETQQDTIQNINKNAI